MEGCRKDGMKSMTLKDGVDALNNCIPKNMDAAVVLLVGLQSQLMTAEELMKLDALRGEKLNLAHDEDWHPELVTREDADLIRRGLDVYRNVLWQMNKEELEEKLSSVVKQMGQMIEKASR